MSCVLTASAAVGAVVGLSLAGSSSALADTGGDGIDGGTVFLSLGFIDDLISWDRNHGDWFGLIANSDKGNLPETLNGLDVEGAEFSPDGSELYVGMRAPIAPMTPGTPQTPAGRR